MEQRVYRHETIRKFESQEFPGVVAYLFKMTEGRRSELRSKIAASNKQLRENMRQQGRLLKVPEGTQDEAAILELQDEFDRIVGEEINPAYITWGVKQISGLEVEDIPLGVDDWKRWPSALFNEVLQAVKEESELEGGERKNSSLATTSGEPGAGSQKLSTVPSATKRDSGKIEIAELTTPIV
jgi:hypothetical protein